MLNEEIRLVRLGDIQPHPLNSFFFDDMTGDKWEDFKASIADGIINRPILTDKLVTTSGWQRIRAVKENGEPDDFMVSCVVRTYESEQEILRELIESNIQQRGTLNCSAVKMGRIAMAMEEIYGIRHGGDRTKPNNVGFAQEDGCSTQADVAAKLQTNMETYRLNKQLAQLAPEFQEMIIRGQITPSTGARLIAKMDESAQEKLLLLLPKDVMQKFTKAEIQAYIEKIAELEDHLCIAQKAISGGLDEWLHLSSERDAAKEKARLEFEKAASMKKEMKETEKRLEKIQNEWEFASARADGSMFEGTPLTMIDSALNGYIRALEYLKNSQQCLSTFNDDQLKYIHSLFGKSVQMTREVSQILRAA